MCLALTILSRSGEEFDAFSKRARGGLVGHLDIVDQSRLIPVIHALSYSGRSRYRWDQMEELAVGIVEDLNSSFVAIPERELGAGLPERAANVRRLLRALQKRGFPTDIHVLGCGTSSHLRCSLR